MKKNLLILSLLLAFSVVFAQQNKQSQVSSTAAKARVETRSSQRTNGVQPAPTSTTSTCMSINYPTVTTWSPTIYSTGTAGAGGFVSGPNQYADKEKAMYFDASASAFTKLYQVDVWFAKGYSSNLSKVVNMKIYDGSSGTLTGTSTAIATASVTMGTIKNDVAGNYTTSFYFPAGVNLPVSKRFFCSVDISNLNWTTSKDSLCIVSNQSGQTIPNAAWEKQSTNTWYQYSNAAAWTQSVSLYIHPFLRNTPVTATFSAVSPALCAGNSITYDATGSTTGGITYWNFGASTSPTTASTNSISVLYPTAGTYTTSLYIFDACDALGAAQTVFTVNAKPTVLATPSATTICNGTNITLSGGGASTYTWTGGVTNGAAFTPSASLNYTVLGTAANGCTNSAVATVTVNALPTVSVTSGAICNGNSYSITPSGASTYTITGGVFSVSPTTNATYSVTGTSAQGCLSSNVAVSSVTVNNLPTVTANSTSTVVCSGNNIILTGGGATTYTWTSGVNDGVAFAPASTNTYSVNGTDANGCMNTATVGITVNSLPSISANTSTNNVCAGNNIILTGSGATTYTWTSGVNDGVAFAPASTNTYSVNGTDVNGCMNSAAVSVTVNNLPTVTANTTSTSICVGSNVTLTGAGATTYTWNNSVTDGVVFAPVYSNTYTVIGFDGNGCQNSATVVVNVNNLPSVFVTTTNTLVCSGDNVVLTGGGAVTYTLTNGVSNGVGFPAVATNTYTVSGTDGNGCVNSATVEIVVSTCTGIKNVASNNSTVSVFPNPNNGDFTIQSQKADVINVTNELGQVIETIELNEGNNFSIKVRNLAVGMYFINGSTINQKIIVTR